MLHVGIIIGAVPVEEQLEDVNRGRVHGLLSSEQVLLDERMRVSPRVERGGLGVGGRGTKLGLVDHGNPLRAGGQLSLRPPLHAGPQQVVIVHPEARRHTLQEPIEGAAVDLHAPPLRLIDDSLAVGGVGIDLDTELSRRILEGLT